MENNSRLVSLRISEEIIKMISEIRNKLYKKEEKELNTSDILRYSIEFTFYNMNKQNMDWEDFMELMKAYIKTAYFNRYTPQIYEHSPSLNRQNVELLDNILYAVEQMAEEYETEEVKELNLLYSGDETMTLAQLLRFRHRLMPETFLNFMGVVHEEYVHLSNSDLANFIEKKLRDNNFKERAKVMFNIDL
ncbi:hypothetical protein [Bacillus mycoides]|uniref:hypothetical protein n=2 Tax=Bacillaceae TaxID=186817 RepID=UPI002E1B4634|nr:hypothetical protein [Bacillus mycoides]